MLTTARKTVEMRGDVNAYPVAADTIIHQGALVVLDAGFAKGGLEKTGLIALGRAEETVDNKGGANGDKVVQVKAGTFGYANDATNPVTLSDVGKDCYIVDDATVSSSHNGNARSVAGKIKNLAGNHGVAVKLG